MKVDGGVGWDLEKVGAEAKALEDMGYSSVMTAETRTIRSFRWWSRRCTHSASS